MKKWILLITTILLLCISGPTMAAPIAPEMCFSAEGLSITVNWTTVPDATGYRLYYAPYPYKGEHTIDSIDMASETSASYYLWNNANYYIAATSRNASGESPYSNIEVFQLTPTSDSSSQISCQDATLEGTWGNGVTNMALLADGTYLVDTNNDGVAEAWGSYDATESQLELTDEGGTSACFDVAIQEFIVGSYAYDINQEAMTLTLIDDGCSGRAASMTTQWDQDDSPSSSITNPSNGKSNSDHIDNDGDGYSESYGDCNDSDSSVNPGAVEIYGDGIDQDCDGDIGPVDSQTTDDDGDGLSENQGDCDDNSSSISPNATEVCDDGIDQDCSGADLECNTGHATTADLAGTWYMRSIGTQKNGLPDDFGYDIGKFIYQSNGSFTGTMTDNEGDSWGESGMSTVNPDGTVNLWVGTGANFNAAMNASKDVITTTYQDNDEFAFDVFVKRGSNYSTADLAGTWYMRSIGTQKNGLPDDFGYDIGKFIYQSNGSFTGTMTDNEGDSWGESGMSTVNPDGTVNLWVGTGANFNAAMNASKDVITTTYQDNDEFAFDVFVKRGSNYSTADLAGTWYMRSLCTQKNGLQDDFGYDIGKFIYQSNGSFTGTMTDNEGDSWGESGMSTVNPDGTVNLWVGTGANFNAAMNASKDVITTTYQDNDEFCFDVFVRVD